MIYRVLNPSLPGLENEGAYLLICKQVLPMGVLGLMLGGMVFATASSVNTTLNLAASVITNDLFKIFRPNATLKQTMSIAKLSTILFGIGTILVALLVPAAGGIVNVVLSVGAVTGCSLYGPIIWAFYSKRHTGRSILGITIISLSINIILKFFADELLGASLSRASEMFVGSVLPFGLLAAYEVYAQINNWQSLDYQKYAKQKSKEKVEENSPVEQNTFGFKVLAVTLFVVSILIIFLGFLTIESRSIVVAVGVFILLISAAVHPLIREKLNLSK